MNELMSLEVILLNLRTQRRLLLSTVHDNQTELLTSEWLVAKTLGQAGGFYSSMLH